MSKKYIGSQEHFEDNVNAHYDYIEAESEQSGQQQEDDREPTDYRDGNCKYHDEKSCDCKGGNCMELNPPH